MTKRQNKNRRNRLKKNLPSVLDQRLFEDGRRQAVQDKLRDEAEQKLVVALPENAEIVAYVGNLAFSVTAQHLVAYLEIFAANSVISCILSTKMYRGHRQSAGWANVSFQNADAFNTVLKVSQETGLNLSGRMLKFMSNSKGSNRIIDPASDDFNFTRAQVGYPLDWQNHLFNVGYSMDFPVKLVVNARGKRLIALETKINSKPYLFEFPMKHLRGVHHMNDGIIMSFSNPPFCYTCIAEHLEHNSDEFVWDIFAFGEPKN